MKTKWFSFLCFLFFTGSAAAQSKSYSRTLAAGFSLPAGDFFQTHFPGIGIEVSAAGLRCGRMSVKPKKKFAFTYGGGIQYYFGKKETVSGYSYHYPAYTFVNAFGGAVYNPHKIVNISLTTGPALSRYNSSTRFNIVANLSASYFLTERWGITPALMLINEIGAAPLWSAGLKASYAF